MIQSFTDKKISPFAVAGILLVNLVYNFGKILFAHSLSF